MRSRGTMAGDRGRCMGSACCLVFSTTGHEPWSEIVGLKLLERTSRGGSRGSESRPARFRGTFLSLECEIVCLLAAWVAVMSQQRPQM